MNRAVARWKKGSSNAGGQRPIFHHAGRKDRRFATARLRRDPAGHRLAGPAACAHILEALAQAARQTDAHGYQPQNGTAGLRHAWAEMYARLYQVQLDPQREMLPLLGSKEGIFHLPLAVIDPGDVVLVPNPGYVTYTQGAAFAGGEAYDLPLLPKRIFCLILIASPKIC